MQKGGVMRRRAMHKSEFDQFADEYHALHAQNIRLSGEEPEYFARYKAIDAARLACPLPIQAVLDFGTGVGNSIPFLREQFPNARLVGFDVSERSLEVAARRFPGMAELRPFDGRRIPADAGAFGLVFVACVLHHVDAAEHVPLLEECRRVLAPGGTLVCFEHNPWNPLTARAVRDCPFDVNAHLIAAPQLRQRCLESGFAHAKIHYRVFFPGSLALLRPLERGLEWFPLGAQYCVVGRT